MTLGLCANLFLSGCRKAVEPTPAVVMKHEVLPQPPKVGRVTIVINLDEEVVQSIVQANVSGYRGFNRL